MTRQACLFACLIVVLAVGREATACATRHFYNYSTVGFAYTIMPSGSCSIGPYTGPVCVIPAGQTADLHYPDQSTNIAVVSLDEGATFPGAAFALQIGCNINAGNTGNITMNSPAEGDITTCGKSGYPCQPSKKKSADLPKPSHN